MKVGCRPLYFRAPATSSSEVTIGASAAGCGVTALKYSFPAQSSNSQTTREREGREQHGVSVRPLKLIIGVRARSARGAGSNHVFSRTARCPGVNRNS
jgi:hypothetical protein|eukprot:COSAG01_NODE_424_length_17253_cov_31.601900_3_plen_98_part_00